MAPKTLGDGAKNFFGNGSKKMHAGLRFTYLSVKSAQACPIERETKNTIRERENNRSTEYLTYPIDRKTGKNLKALIMLSNDTRVASASSSRNKKSQRAT